MDEKRAGETPAGQQRDRFGREFRLRGGLVQRDVEAWNRVYVELRPVGVAEQRGAQLRAGIVAGWIESPATAAEQRVDLESGRTWVVYLFDGVEVGDMPPVQVAYYGRACERAFYQATRIPDEVEKN